MVLKRRQDSFHSKANEGRVSSGTARGNDIEQGLNGGIPKLDPNEKSKLPLAGSDGLDMYLLVKNTVNYFDIDLTPKGMPRENQEYVAYDHAESRQRCV